MAWTTPMTATYNTVFTAAQWNTHIRDNSGYTMPALASQTASRWYVAIGANEIAQRAISSNVVTASEATTSTSYANLTTNGAAVTVTTGARALVFFGSSLQHGTTDATAYVSVAVSGATTTSASDEWALILDGVTASNRNQFGTVKFFDALTAGSNTFTMKYRVDAGTGTFHNRQITVVGM